MIVQLKIDDRFNYNILQNIESAHKEQLLIYL